MKLGKAVKPLIKLWISWRGENCRSHPFMEKEGDEGKDWRMLKTGETGDGGRRVSSNLMGGKKEISSSFLYSNER